MKHYQRQPRAQYQKVHYVTPAVVETLIRQSSLPVLVRFQARLADTDTTAPTLAWLTGILRGQIRAVQVDVAAHPCLAERFKIRVLPTVLIFEHGLPLEFIVGLTPDRYIVETVSKIVGAQVRTYTVDASGKRSIVHRVRSRRPGRRHLYPGNERLRLDPARWPEVRRDRWVSEGKKS